MRIADYRPIPFWSWNDQMNERELIRQIEEMHAQGFGGFFMHSRIGLVTTYLSERWFELVGTCVRRAEQLGMEVWLYDEDRWPSGYAGGRVPLADPSFRERMLFCVPAHSEVEEDTFICTFDWDGETYRIGSKFADWNNPYFNGTSYLDTFNPEATKEFLRCTHEEYRARFGQYFGNVIRGVFTDEPCYGLYTFYRIPAVPYSPILRKKYLSVYGEDILDRVAELFFETGDWRRTRWRYYTLANRAFCEGFFKPYSDWCRENGLLLTGHVMAEEGLVEQLRWTGGAMPCYEYFDIPGVDKLFREFRQTVSMKQVASAAAQLGRPRVLSECFAGIGNDCGFLPRKAVVDRQAVLGINLVNPHLAAYSIRGVRKRDYPPTLFYQQPYWTEEGEFSAYVESLSRGFCETREDVKILVIHPIASGRMLYSPYSDHAREQEIDSAFDELTEQLVSRGIGFHFGDETLLEKYGRVENTEFIVGEKRYETVILPETDCLGKKVYSLLETFSQSGGQILRVGTLPVYLAGEPFVFGLPTKKLDLEELTPDVFSDTAGLLFNVRQGAEGRRCFVVNPSAQNIEAELTGGNKLSMPAYSSVWIKESEKGWMQAESQTPVDGQELIPNRVRRMEENALILERANFWVNGEKIYTDTPLAAVWYRHFYNLPEGTPFSLVYSFETSSSLDLTAVIENAENLDKITIDDRLVSPLRVRGEEQVLNEKAYRDVSFTRVPLGEVPGGKHLLRIEGKKVNNVNGLCSHIGVDWKGYDSTEAEAVYLIGDFDVDTETRILNPATELLNAQDLQRTAPFYSGHVRGLIRAPFRRGDRLELVGDFASAALWIDGKRVCGAVLPPYVLSFDRDCQEAEIEIANTLYPLIGPHHIREYDKKLWIDPGLFWDLDQLEEKTRVLRYSLDHIIWKQGEES